MAEVTTDPLSDWFRKIGTGLSIEDYEEGVRLIHAAHDADVARVQPSREDVATAIRDALNEYGPNRDDHYRAAEFVLALLPGHSEAEVPRVALDADGSLDDLAATDAYVRIERMAANRFWIAVEAGGERWTFDVTTKRAPITIDVREQPDSEGGTDDATP